MIKIDPEIGLYKCTNCLRVYDVEILEKTRWVCPACGLTEFEEAPFERPDSFKHIQLPLWKCLRCGFLFPYKDINRYSESCPRCGQSGLEYETVLDLKKKATYRFVKPWNQYKIGQQVPKRISKKLLDTLLKEGVIVMGTDSMEVVE